MNARMESRESMAICGELGAVTHGCCLRPDGHWGPHVVLDLRGIYRLVQTACCPISFVIAEPVALIAINDKEWTWSE